MKEIGRTNVTVFKVLTLFKKMIEELVSIDREILSSNLQEEEKRDYKLVHNGYKRAVINHLRLLREILESEENIAAYPLIVATVLQLLWEYGYPVNDELKPLLKNLLPEAAKEIVWGPDGKQKGEDA